MDSHLLKIRSLLNRMYVKGDKFIEASNTIYKLSEWGEKMGCDNKTYRDEVLKLLHRYTSNSLQERELVSFKIMQDYNKYKKVLQ